MLNGWKAIAAFLQRDERTAMRWAANRNMPVHRVPGRGRGSVYALADELRAWFEADRAMRAPHPPLASTASPMRACERCWIGTSLIAAGALLIAMGATTLHPSRSER